MTTCCRRAGFESGSVEAADGVEGSEDPSGLRAVRTASFRRFRLLAFKSFAVPRPGGFSAGGPDVPSS